MSTDLHIRRVRRLDFVAVMALLADSGLPVPPADRRTLRRFRQIVADLGGDFYLAVIGDIAVGVVHATYSRRLAVAPVAAIDQLVVARSHRRTGIGGKLLAFVAARARRRGCDQLTVTASSSDVGAFLVAAGLERSGDAMVAQLGSMD